MKAALKSRKNLPVSLNLGCGTRPRTGALNTDRAKGTPADLYFDLERRPWPLPSDHFREVFAFDVLEHLEDVPAFFEEVHRVATRGAVVHLTVPHFSSANAFTDPTHKRFFGVASFDYFTQENELSFYSTARFEKISVRIFFHPGLLNRLLWRLAAWFPRRYERRWAWIFPAWFVEARLRVMK